MFLYKLDEQEIKLTSCTSEHKVFSEEKTSTDMSTLVILLQTLIKEEVKVSVVFTALR